MPPYKLETIESPIPDRLGGGNGDTENFPNGKFSTDFYSFSQPISLFYAERIKEIQKNFDDPIENPDDPIIFLGRNADAHVEAEAFPAIGGMALSERILSSEELSPEVRTIILHERTHLHVGGEFRREMIKNHPDVHTFLHKFIIPKWLNGEISLNFNRDYIDQKSWEMVFRPDGSMVRIPAYGFDDDAAREVIDYYFKAFAEGRIIAGDTRAALGMFIVEKSPEQPATLEEMFQKNPQECAMFLMTGYEIIKTLTERKRNRLGDLWIVEENFANYVSTTITGVSIDDLHRFSRQEEEKYLLSRQLVGSRDKEAAIADLRSVDNYASLSEFWKENYKQQ